MQAHNIVAPFDKMIFASERPVQEVMNFLAQNRQQFLVFLGSYKGELEVSYVVDSTAYATLYEQGFLDNQESVLLIHPYSKDVGGYKGSILELSTLKFSTVGTLQPITLGEVSKYEGWSYNPFSNRYMTLVPDTLH